ncbi:MAG: prenyltransferase [Phycisphaerales bacterium]|nr:MAG: prenyltransferase [Phycisphaerales bacterium]
MAVLRQYQPDVDAILARRGHLGADFWTTPDRRIGKGSPFAAVDCALMLADLGVSRTDPAMRGAAEVLFDAWQEDGRFRIAPKQTIYPCHTATVARTLCWLGCARDKRMARTFEHLLEIQHTDGGWRCNVCKLGQSPITDASNPGVTLAALDAFRFTAAANREKRLDRAVSFLLDHWDTRRPLGPCEFGIGSRFMQVEYPFLRYNLFYYVYVLSFYKAAHRDKRFQAAMEALTSKLDADGNMIVEAPRRELAKMSFCRKGEASAAATKRYREIVTNVGA